MKFSGLGGALLLATLVSASAQVAVEVTQEQDQFLQGESLPVAVRITNRSGEPLTLGSDADWLTFSMESRDGFIVGKNSDPPVSGEFVLESSKVAIKRLDLAPYFNLTHSGRYGIIANVHIRQWGKDVTSRPRYFDIIDGAKLWEQEVGVPKPAGAADPTPDVRRYVLQEANYIKGQLRLYLRVTDGYGRPLRVLQLGPMVSFGQPEPQVDAGSHLHVLYQFGPVAFNYTEVDSEGNLLARHVYDYIGTRPHLKLNDDGKITVVGGLRRLTPNDIPPSDLASAFQPSGTNSVESPPTMPPLPNKPAKP